MTSDRPGIAINSYGVSVFVIKLESDAHKVLLLLRSARETLQDMWCQVAGAVEPGETAWQAALRELREETGLTPSRLYSADICEQFYDLNQDRIEIVPVFVAFLDSDQQITLNDEHTAYRWVTFEEARDLLVFAGQRSVLAAIKREFLDRQPNERLRIQLTP
jgi:dATP pyrophosphohydrolase